ncbi:MAG: hypothetical protein WCA59_19510 [Candidatus Binataceae bacterium]
MDLSETTPLKSPFSSLSATVFISQAIVSPLRRKNHVQGAVKRFPGVYQL